MKPIYWLTAMMALWMVQACKKEQLATFEVPSSYRYNSPHLDSKQVFAIGPSGNIRSLADTIGSFNRPSTLVYDPFVGSGTTMVAARDLGMRGVGTDIDKEYVAYATERLRSPRNRDLPFRGSQDGARAQGAR